MEYVIGAIAGLVFGGIVAFLKGKFLWKRSLNSDTPEHLGGVMAASAISFAVNVLALALIFLLRTSLPFNWAACLIAAAVAMSVVQPFLVSRYKPKDQTAGMDR